MYCDISGKIHNFLNNCRQDWSGNNYNYSILKSEDVDAMWRVSPVDYSMNNKRMKVGIIYWL
jgi:hypothetical protein